MNIVALGIAYAHNFDAASVDSTLNGFLTWSFSNIEQFIESESAS